MKEYVVGIDVGTTGAKTIIFTPQGEVVDSAYKEYGCTYPAPNWVEQDATMLFESVLGTLVEAIKKSGIDPQAITSLGFSTQRCCAIFVDKAGKPLKMISWQDNRPVDEVAEIYGKITGDQFYQKTGLPLGTTWLLPKMMWVKKNEPELWGNTAYIVQPHDFVIKEFGANQYYTPETDASFMCTWNVDNISWDQDLIERFSVDQRKVPEVREVGTVVGMISQRIASLTGMRKDVPLCMGAGDQSAAALGAGVVSQGDVSVSLGTGGMMIACTDTPMRDPSNSFVVTNHVIHGKWQWEGLQKASAGVYRWLRDEIATHEKYIADKAGRDVFELLGDMVANVPAGAKGLVMLPYFASSATPHWNANARGSLIGLTFAHDKACMARAFIEGITMEHRDMMRSLNNSGIYAKKIRIIGGPTKSKIWNQIQADIYNTPVETLKVSDAAVLGAAITGAVGAGRFTSLTEGVDAMVKPSKMYEPIAENVAVYQEVFDAYSAAYESLSTSVFDKIADLQARNV